MNSNIAETVIGAAVLVVAAWFVVYAAQSRGMAGGSGTYDLIAEFGSVEGIAVGSEVRLAGIRVGTVEALDLDPRTYQVDARFTMRDDLKIPEDSEVRISSEGLLGGAFLEVRAGQSDFLLGDGGRLYNTSTGEGLLNQLLQFGFQR